jgi:peptidoglycan/LPS O-acetylase OafA/YrhL
MSVENKRYLYSHTALRGIGASIVLIAHILNVIPIHECGIICNFFSWWDQAVDLFFVLSGFIINYVYGDKTGIFSWKKYSLSRIFRILPLYYITLIPFLPPYITTFRIFGLSYDNYSALKRLILNITLTAGLLGENHVNELLNVPSWSISVELICYFLIFPPLLFFCQRIKKHHLASIIVTTTILVYLSYKINIWDIGGFNIHRIVRGVLGFTLGYFLCSLFRQNSNFKIREVILPALISIFCYLIVNGMIKELALLMPLIVYYTAFERGLICNTLNTSVLQWLGQRSYSIYLWHCPIIYTAYIPLSNKLLPAHKSGIFFKLRDISILVAVVFLVSELSYRYFEMPIRKLARRFS